MGYHTSLINSLAYCKKTKSILSMSMKERKKTSLLYNVATK